MRIPLLIALPLLSLTLLFGQSPVNGPMPCYVDMLEARIWMQCHGPCRAEIEYWPEAHPDSILSTAEQFSKAENANALTFTLDRVVPGTRYGYRVVLDGKIIDVGEPLGFHTQPLWRYRGDPPAFTFATGSCAYINETAYDRPGKPYGGEYGIFNSIADAKPDLMLWLGDNLYLREPDWGSWSGIMHRYTHTRSLPELQHLLRSTEHVAIWDDHDFGPNDADASFAGAAMTRKAFDLFWSNPTSGVPGVPGITTEFSYVDCDFFLMDDRSFRVPPEVVTATPTQLGQPQIDWLIQALKFSNAPFKFVALGGQFLTTENAYETYSTYPVERQRIIDRIEQEHITGVIFLTGDRHFTAMSELPLKDGNVIRDLTVSPLTSSPFKSNGKNDLLLEGTYVDVRNYALLNVSGPANERVLHIGVHASDGKLLWERDVPQPKP